VFLQLICTASDGCVNVTDMSSENESEIYKTVMIALAALLALVLACCIIVAVVLCKCAGYSQYSQNFFIRLSFVLVVGRRTRDRRTRDRKIAGSTPGRGVIKSTRSTQRSIAPG